MGAAASLEIGTTGFWHRQFSGVATRGQQFFDGAFGVVVPVIALITIPHRLSHSDWGWLEQTVLWVLGIQMTSLWLWHAGGRHLPCRPLFGSLLIGGGVISLVSGAALSLLIFPYTVAPVLLLPLACTPVLAGFVYLRNGVRVINARWG